MKKIILIFSALILLTAVGCKNDNTPLDDMTAQTIGKAPIINGTLVSGNYIQTNGELFPSTTTVGQSFSWVTTFFTKGEPIENIEIYAVIGKDTSLLSSVAYASAPVGFSNITQTDTMIQSMTITPDLVSNKTTILSAVKTQHFETTATVKTMSITN